MRDRPGSNRAGTERLRRGNLVRVQESTSCRWTASVERFGPAFRPRPEPANQELVTGPHPRGAGERLARGTCDPEVLVWLMARRCSKCPSSLRGRAPRSVGVTRGWVSGCALCRLRTPLTAITNSLPVAVVRAVIPALQPTAPTRSPTLTPGTQQCLRHGWLLEDRRRGRARSRAKSSSWNSSGPVEVWSFTWVVRASGSGQRDSSPMSALTSWGDSTQRSAGTLYRGGNCVCCSRAGP